MVVDGKISLALMSFGRELYVFCFDNEHLPSLGLCRTNAN